MEDRLARIEDMLVQLVGMVAKTNTLQQEMQRDMKAMKGDMTSMQGDMTSMQGDMTSMREDFEAEKIKSAQRHEEVVDRLKALELDQDFIWEKTARNERELEVLKRRLG
ncbi:hypothetical protein D1B31_04325 [Neobacillus notoginsengisoli]|uniref:DUF1640 domain-containing protein n=1 Tax=Neobacillus notoginsengisoli TaxID=1578198 RepID=A0A417YZ71_9BACI|nr:hypothetical protein [Neobacillus notoginsengisoli]RHW42810.1 hypothetical protein D1B31_04325 [Neobacillus notoginsengisoli]